MAEDDFIDNVNRTRPDEVYVPRGLFARRNRGGPSRRRPVDEILNAVEGESDALKSFKVGIPMCLKAPAVRPIPTCCTFCFPEIRKTVSSTYTTLGIRNCLNYAADDKMNGQEEERYWDLIYFWRKVDLFSKYKLIAWQEIIEDAELIMDLEKREKLCKEKNLEIKDLRNKAIKFLESLGFSASKWVYGLYRRFGSWLATRILTSVFQAVCIHEGQIKLLESYQQAHPFIYVPLQKSIWDHFILTWALLQSNLKPPITLARQSLASDPLFGRLGRLSGCLGNRIVKKIKYDDNADPVIDIALKAYLKNILKSGGCLEWAVEQHRSRMGYPGTVFVGTEIFDLISTCIKNHEIEEAFIVPVNIAYEKFPEPEIIGNYNRSPSANIFSRIWKVLKLRLGFVRINFGHPISFREYQNFVMTQQKLGKLLQKTRDNEFFWLTEGYCNALESHSLNWDSRSGSVTSLSPFYRDIDILRDKTEASTLFGDALTCHTVYDAFKCNVFMSTNLVAFLLLTKYRESGVETAVLESDVGDLVSLIRRRKGDVGFSTTCALNAVVARAVQLLGPELVLQEKRGEGKIVYAPVKLPSSLVQLSYYGNPLIAFFAMEGVIATALFALCGTKLAVYNDSRTKVFVGEDALVVKATQVALFLKAQFLLHPPCQQLDEAIKSGIDASRDEFMILHEVRKLYRNDNDLDDWTNVGGGDYSYSAERLEIRTVEDPRAYRWLCHVRSLIVPYLIAYAKAFSELRSLEYPQGGQPVYMSVQDLRQLMFHRLVNSPDVPPEVAVMDTVKNLLIAVQHLGIIEEESDKATGNILIRLHAGYSSHMDLDIVENNILYFCSF